MPKKPTTTAAQREADEQWARDKVRWTISNCVRSIRAHRRIHREFAKRLARRDER